MIRPIAVMEAPGTKVRGNKEIEMPDSVPYVADLLTDPEQKRKIIALSNIIDRYSKIFMAPPKTPDHLVNVLRASYEALLKDKDFVERLEVLQGDPVDYVPGDVVERDIRQMVKDYVEFKDEFKTWEEWARVRF